jgi:hypothetical protein
MEIISKISITHGRKKSDLSVKAIEANCTKAQGERGGYALLEKGNLNRLEFILNLMGKVNGLET